MKLSDYKREFDEHGNIIIKSADYKPPRNSILIKLASKKEPRFKPPSEKNPCIGGCYVDEQSKRFYTNQQLAALLRQTVEKAQFRGWYTKQVKILEEMEINISEFYDQNGSLRNLKIEGVGPRSKMVLEKILELGPEDAASELFEIMRRELNQENPKFSRFEGSLSGEGLPGRINPILDDFKQAHKELQQGEDEDIAKKHK